MRKITAFLLCLCLLSAGSVTALAQNVSKDEGGGSAVITVTVPDSHTLTISARYAQVLCEGQRGDSFSVERLSSPRLLIRPEDGYRVTKITLNGEDVTPQVQGGYYTLGPVYEDKTLAVETEEVSASPDNTHDINGTLTDEDGNPLPGVTVDVGGKTDVTDENGKFTIKDVPGGYHPVTITDKDGSIIGYTEMEMGEGEPGIIQNPDGSYMLTVPEDAAFGLELTVTEDGRVSVDRMADITPEQPGESDESGSGGGSEGPQTGDNSNIFLWIILMFVSGIGIIGITKKRRCDTK